MRNCGDQIELAALLVPPVRRWRVPLLRRLRFPSASVTRRPTPGFSTGSKQKVRGRGIKHMKGRYAATP